MDEVKKAINILKQGGIVIFPTDTAIGIGCRIDNPEAVRKLFKIRRRSESKPMLALVSSLEMAKKYWKEIPQDVLEKLIKKYWPGPLTLVLHSAKVRVPEIVTGGTGTLGVRFPSNKILLELIGGVGVPILAPSANFAGEKTPYSFEDLNPELVKQADYLLKTEISQGENVSTVIDCSVKPWKIVRSGALSLSF